MQHNSDKMPVTHINAYGYWGLKVSSTFAWYMVPLLWPEFADSAYFSGGTKNSQLMAVQLTKKKKTAFRQLTDSEQVLRECSL